MYQNQSGKIDTRVGTGEAVVNDSPFIDLTELGKYVGANTKHAKRRKQIKKVQEEYADFEVDKKGLTQSQLEVLNPILDKFAEFTTSDKSQSDPNFYNNFQEKLKEVMSVGQQFKGLAEIYNNMGAGLGKDADIAMIDGVDGFRGAYFKAFAYDEDGELKDPTTLMVDMKEAMDGMQKHKVYNPFELLPAGKTEKTVDASMSGNIETKVTKNTLTPANLEHSRGVVERAIENVAAGKTKDPLQARWMEMATERLNNQDPTLLASAKNEQEALVMLKQAAGDIAEEYMIAQHESEDKAEDYQKPSTRGVADKNYLPSNYEVARETLPSTINVNGKEISTGVINRDAAAVRKMDLNVKDSTGSEVVGKLIKVSYDKDGNKVVIVNVPLKTGSDSYSTKNVEPMAVPYEEVAAQIDARDKALHEELFAQMDPSSSSYEGFTQAEINNISSQISELSDNYTEKGNKKLAQMLFGNSYESVYDPWGGNNFGVKINGEEYEFDVDDDDSKEELIRFAIEQRGTPSAPKPKEEGTTKEDLERTEGMTDSDRKFYLKEKETSFTINGESYTIEELLDGGWKIEDIKNKLK